MYRIAIVGYGNVGRGVECALWQVSDMELVCVFSRREGVRTASGVPVYPLSEASQHKSEVDALILCSGSATDLPVMGPSLAASFNTVDSFDNHAHIPEYYAAMNSASTGAETLSLISAGWDPGLFSLTRVLSSAVLPACSITTFWGRGVSQGHSDAVRRVPGVKRAVQYTVPIESAVQAAYEGNAAALSAREKHRRVCYVVLAPGADKAKVEQAIKTMPDYFAPYESEVNFISEEEFNANHTGMPHAGKVIVSGVTADKNPESLEFSLKLSSNPEFTGAVLVACARAVCRMAGAGRVGTISMLDVPFSALSPLSADELRSSLL